MADAAGNLPRTGHQVVVAAEESRWEDVIEALTGNPLMRVLLKTFQEMRVLEAALAQGVEHHLVALIQKGFKFQGVTAETVLLAVLYHFTRLKMANCRNSSGSILTSNPENSNIRHLCTCEPILIGGTKESGVRYPSTSTPIPTFDPEGFNVTDPVIPTLTSGPNVSLVKHPSTPTPTLGPTKGFGITDPVRRRLTSGPNGSLVSHPSTPTPTFDPERSNFKNSFRPTLTCGSEKYNARYPEGKAKLEEDLAATVTHSEMEHAPSYGLPPAAEAGNKPQAIQPWMDVFAKETPRQVEGPPKSAEEVLACAMLGKWNLVFSALTGVTRQPTEREMGLINCIIQLTVEQQKDLLDIAAKAQDWREIVQLLYSGYVFPVPLIHDFVNSMLCCCQYRLVAEVLLGPVPYPFSPHFVLLFLNQATVRTDKLDVEMLKMLVDIAHRLGPVFFHHPVLREALVRMASVEVGPEKQQQKWAALYSMAFRPVI